MKSKVKSKTRKKTPNPSKSKSVLRREAVQNEILSCPFCDGESTKLVKLEKDCWYVRCERCNCEGPSSTDRKIALQSWNKADRQDWHYCHTCQLQRGGKVPKENYANTVMSGKCSRCKQPDVTLCPNADYFWPGKAFLWD